MKALAKYLTNLTAGRILLWCYLIWYLVVLVRYFDPSPRIWLTSLGLSAIVGIALFISSTANGNKLQPWQIARLFMMPFCVSSFSGLVKGRGFTLVFSSNPMEILLALSICAVFCATVWLVKWTQKRRA